MNSSSSGGNDNKSKNKKAFVVAMALALEFFAMSLAGIFGGQYLGGLGNQATLGAILGFVIASGLWIWRLVSTKRHIL